MNFKKIADTSFKHPEPELLVFGNIANHSDDFTKKSTIKHI